MKKTILLTVVLFSTKLFSQIVTTYAGSGSFSSIDATGTSASFNAPVALCSDNNGNLFVVDQSGIKIRKIAPGAIVTTLAGSGSIGSTDAVGNAASFYVPTGISINGTGDLFVADFGNNKIRTVNQSSVVSTFAGSGSQGSTDATGVLASFKFPYGTAVDKNGNVYVADQGNNKIRMITPSGVVTTIAGTGTVGSTDATGTSASFNQPTSVAIDTKGNIYVADYGNHKIRKINSLGIVTTFAGSGSVGSNDAIGTTASFNYPSGVVTDIMGNVYVADLNNHKIRKIGISGAVTTLAGTGTAGSFDAPSWAATFNQPMGVTVDLDGNVYVADYNNNKIRKITQPCSQPSVNSISSSSLICSGETATLTISGTAITYSLNSITSQTTVVISPTVTTTYTISGSTFNNCLNSITLTQSVSVCTGIDSYNSNLVISIFPNPNDGNLVIKSMNEGSYQLINCLGQTIKTFQLNSSNNFTTTIDELSQGIYNVVGKMNNQTVSQKIVVIK